MTADPITDLLHFLIGDTGDYNRFGAIKYVSVVFYIILLVAGATIAWLNWRRDPNQRTLVNVWVFAMRVVAGGMWFQGTIWKLPLPVADGFKFWLTQEGKFSAIPLQGTIVRDVLLPHIALLQPLIYATEILFTVSLTLGLAVPLFGVAAAIFTAQLWLGLYNDPTEWPWTYMAIIFAHGMFAVSKAGRSLGLDSVLIRNAAKPFDRMPLLGRAWRIAS